MTSIIDQLPWSHFAFKTFELKRAKALFIKMNRDARIQDDVITCFRDGIVTLRKNRRLEGFTESLKEIGYQGIRSGDLIIHSMDAFAGAIGVSDSDGKGSPVYFVCRARDEVNVYYFAYLLREMARNGWIQALSRGIRERSSDFRYVDFVSQYLPVPLKKEQDYIVRFLDYKNLMLRGGVSQKQRLVELMEEYKRAVIQQAVTRGLDPDVPLKPSGFEWLGDIPEHWEVRRLRTLTKIINGATPSTQDPLNWDGDIGWLTPEDLGKLTTRYVQKGSRSITLKGYESCGATLAPSGSLAISTRAPIGHIGILQQEACVNQGCRLLTPNNLVESAWLYFSLKAFNDELSSLGQGSTFTELSRDKLGDFAIALPPLPEQTAIVAHLDKLTSDIDAAITHTRREIELLGEYRTRLIADVVTGKLDVREATANLPDVDLDDIQPLAEGGEADD